MIFSRKKFRSKLLNHLYAVLIGRVQMGAFSVSVGNPPARRSLRRLSRSCETLGRVEFNLSARLAVNVFRVGPAPPSLRSAAFGRRIFRAEPDCASFFKYPYNLFMDRTSHEMIHLIIIHQRRSCRGGLHSPARCIHEFAMTPSHLFHFFASCLYFFCQCFCSCLVRRAQPKLRRLPFFSLKNTLVDFLKLNFPSSSCMSCDTR